MRSLLHTRGSVLTALVIGGLVAWTSARPQALLRPLASPSVGAQGFTVDFDLDLATVLARLDGSFERRWRECGLTPAAPAPEIQVLRRVSLALHGTIPALEDIREFEADRGPDRLLRRTVRLLADDRCADYLAERLAVALVGDRTNDLPEFRRERFVGWLSGELRRGRPYDELVRRLVAASGQPTVSGPANFLSAETAQGEAYANRLAGRTARAFLGQRIDCAECHDHPFAEWTRTDFQGLAAYYGKLTWSRSRLYDDRGREHLVEDPKTLQKRFVSPRVPFHPEWLPRAGSRREQLAGWLTHPENRRFRRAIANRVWGLMFGRPLQAPVDDMPDPPAPAADDGDEMRSEPLDLLGDDLAAHGFDLRRLALVIAASRPFRLASSHVQLSSPPEATRALVAEWAVFPLVPLRPEQLGRSLQQVQTVQRLRSDDSVYARTSRAHWRKELLEEYGDLGELELDEPSSSVQQMVVRMSGRFTRESVRSRPRSATDRIAGLAASDRDCLEACSLVCLTRPPTADEQAHFLEQLRNAGRGRRRGVVEDIFWAMVNSPEFVWNH